MYVRNKPKPCPVNIRVCFIDVVGLSLQRIDGGQEMSRHGFDFLCHRIHYDLVFSLVHHGVERVTGDHDFARRRLTSQLFVKHLVDVAIDHHKPEYFFCFWVVDRDACQ